MGRGFSRPISTTEGELMNELFSYNPDISKNAYLNWNTDKNDYAYNMYLLASDYADGAITLINSILIDNRDKKADALIMPVLYCIDQSIEVYIKAVLRKIEIITGSAESVYKSHDIKELLNCMTGMIKKKEIKTAGLQKHLSPVSSFIDELYPKIQVTDKDGRSFPGMDFARYPITTEGKPHFYISANENVVIDVENLGKRFVEIRECLEALYLMYEAEAEAFEEQSQQ